VLSLAVGAAVLVLLTGLAARAFDRLLTQRMAELKSLTITTLENMAGRRITYADISPSIFQYLEVRDLTIFDSRDPDQELLTVHDIRVYYSLARLLLRRDPVGALREIRILNTRFALDIERDRDVLDLFTRLAGTQGGQGQVRVRVTGANVTIALTSGDTSLSLRDLFFEVEAQKQAIVVSLRGKCQGELPHGFTFAAAIKLQGTLDRSLTASDLTVRLLSFQSSLFTSESQTLQLVWSGNTIEVRKIQDRSPVVIAVLADLGKQTVTLNFQAEDLRPDRLFDFAPRLAGYRSWLKAPLTASGHVTWRYAANTFDYEADASLYLEDQLPIHQVTLDSSFRGSEKDMFFAPLRLSSSRGALQFEGDLLLSNFSPNGILTLADIDPGTGEKVSADLAIERQKDRFEVHGTKLVLGEIHFADLALTVSPVPGGAAFSLSTAFADSHAGDLVQASGNILFGSPVGRLMKEGRGEALTAPTVTMAGTLRNIPPEQLYHLAMGAGNLSPKERDMYGLLSQFSVTADIALSTDFKNIALISRQVTIEQWDDPSLLVQFGLNADNGHVALTDFSGAWKGLKVEGGFDGRFGSGGQVSFSTDLKFLSTDYSFTGRYSPERGLYASGSYGLVISAAPQKDGSLSFGVKGNRFPLPAPGRTIPITFDIAGTTGVGGAFSADIASVTVFDVPFLESKTNTLRLAGKLTPGHLDIASAAFADQFSTLAGSARIDFRLPEDLLDPQIGKSAEAHILASLQSQDGKESYSVEGSLAKGSPSLNFLFSGSPLARITQAAIKGALSGKGTVTGTLERPSADISVTLVEGRLGTDNLSLSGQIGLRPDTIRVSGLSIGYLSHALSDGAGAVDMKKGTYTFAGRYNGEYFRDNVQLSVGIDGQFGTAGLDGLFTRPLDHGMSGKLVLGGITVAGSAFPSWGVEYRTNAGRLSFDGGPGSSIHGWLDPNLAFSLRLSAPLPISGTAAGRFLGDRINATLDVETLDLLVLNPVLKSPLMATSAGPVPIIDVTSGAATGRFSVQGPVNDPDYSGQLEIVGGGVRSAYSPDEAGPVRTTLIFDGKTFHTPKTFAEAGSARLSCQANFTIDHWAPVAFDISLATEGQAPVRVRARFGRLISEGSASVAMKIAGDDKKTTVSGTMVVSDCRITLGDAQEVKFVPEEVPTFVTMTAETGRRVEFTWPSDNLPVLRTTATPGGKIAITYRGDTGAYTVKGAAGVQAGEIYYFDRSFIVKRGSISFNEDQDTFDPRITASAEVREWDPYTGEEVKIYLDADSTLSKFSPRFSSDPARSNSAILAMIGAPIVNSMKSQGLGMAPLVYSDILTQTWILRPFEQKVRQMLNLDLFSIRTQILQNLVAQRLFSSTTANSPLDALDNTSLSLGKYIGNDLFWEALVRLQTPQFPTLTALPPGSLQQNELFQTAENITPGLATPWGFQIDLELSVEWATPFFLMTWSWLPQHPETMYLQDNSLMFSWRYSY
jgi:translocation and assembly module TamB